MAYQPKEWVNTVYDDEGNVLRKGTPLMAEDMNRVDGTLEEVANSRGKPSGIATLDDNGLVYSTQLPSSLKEIRVVANIIERDTLDRFEGLRVLVNDATTDDTVDEGWAEYVWDGVEFIKVAEAESLDIVLDWANIKGKPSEYNPSGHTHNSDDIENLYVTHEHSNKEVLDKLTQGTLEKIDNNEQKIEDLEGSNHTHDNKPSLDKLIYSGVKSSVDLIALEELERHTHDDLHTHSNKQVIDKFTEVDNKPYYNGEEIGGASTIPDPSTLMPISGGVLENYREKLATVSAANGSINLSLGNVFQHSPSGNRTYSITNAVNGQAHSFTLIVNMGSTVRTLTFPSSVKWQGGEIPDMSTADKTYVLTFMTVDGGTNWLGMFGGEF